MTTVETREREPRVAGRAIVVGASSGIGAALVRQLAAEGWRVVALARRAAALEGLAREAAERGCGEVSAVVHDVHESDAAAIILATAGLVSLFFAATLIVAMRRVRLILTGQVAPADGSAPGKQFRLVRLGATLAALTGMVILGALILGYLPFAWFLSKQVVWTALILAAFALIASLLDALGSTYFSPDSPAGARFARLEDINPKWMAQFGVVLVSAAKLLAAIAGLLLIAAPWGVSSVGLVAKARSALTGFDVGGFAA